MRGVLPEKKAKSRKPGEEDTEGLETKVKGGADEEEEADSEGVEKDTDKLENNHKHVGEHGGLADGSRYEEQVGPGHEKGIESTQLDHGAMDKVGIGEAGLSLQMVLNDNSVGKQLFNCMKLNEESPKAREVQKYEDNKGLPNGSPIEGDNQAYSAKV